MLFLWVHKFFKQHKLFNQDDCHGGVDYTKDPLNPQWFKYFAAD